MSTPSYMDEARALLPTIRAAADQIEQQRRLPVELVRKMAQHGLFRLCVPRALGGGEVDVATMARVIETASEADGSAGWCVMIGVTSSLLAAYLPLSNAAEIYGSPDGVSAGVFAPLGKAVVADGGYRVSGRWAFASGCQHCDWLMGGCVVMEDGKPRLLPNGAPETRMMLFPAAAVQIHDTWHVSGLRGTGSHDISVDNLFVANERSASFITDSPRHAGTLYKFPVFGLLALGIAAVALGVARHAIDELCRLAGAKMPSGSRRKLAERPIIQTQVAQAEAQLRSARALLFNTVAEVTAQAESAEIGIEPRALLRLAATHATDSAVKAVDMMYTAGGGTSIYADSPLQRCFRDVHVATQHMMVAQPTYEVAGRVFLGIETDVSLV